eukprot:NODE_3428_length_787_cov_296.039617.p1 GENE.NODE_3428_length_787_cov_296.039617~~NODE_3428_length_787_cov_296.039617.p1  ORF type:complete len:217 (+),score=39.83 NODE_3428_length_787_cov_296.039617:3-653(+)
MGSDQSDFNVMLRAQSDFPWAVFSPFLVASIHMPYRFMDLKVHHASMSASTYKAKTRAMSEARGWMRVMALVGGCQGPTLPVHPTCNMLGFNPSSPPPFLIRRNYKYFDFDWESQIRVEEEAHSNYMHDETFFHLAEGATFAGRASLSRVIDSVGLVLRFANASPQTDIDTTEDKKKGLHNTISDLKASIAKVEEAIATLKEETAALEAGVQFPLA